MTAGPALVLAELATRLPLAMLVELANEFQSTFSRDPLDPRSPQAILGVLPLATQKALLAELASMGSPTATRVLRAVALSSENTWSPRESILATMATLPLAEGGYGLGPLMLNKRLTGKDASRTSRVPDIMLGPSTNVGINYDGWDHLDLVSFEKTAISLGTSPGSARAQAALDATRRQIRAKYVDDRRRDRDLLAMGVETLVATSEDLMHIESLDLLMRQAINRIMQGRRQTAHDALGEMVRALDDPAHRERRRQNLQTLLHGL